MAPNQSQTALAQDLGEAIDELQLSLTRASDAATRIRGLIPRVGAVNALLDEIESVIHAGRQEFGAPRATLPDSFTRPTLVASEGAPAEQPAPAPSPAWTNEPQPQATTTADELICFRLEFQSSGGPLDLRAVDDAVGEHPAVRDVALLDYDGRNATLKVWIVASVSPADVQGALSERAAEIFAPNGEVTIVALEDAA
jgi:hypothetical protein